MGLRYLCIVLSLASCAPPEEDDFNRDDEPDLAVVQGEDQRARVSAEDSTTYPWRAVAALRQGMGRSTASCTAFAVGPRHLLTAAHCVEARDKLGSYHRLLTEKTARLVLGQYGSGDAPENMPVHGRPLAVEAIHVPAGWAASEFTDRRHDWALLRLRDEDSLPDWFDARWRTDQLVRAASELLVDGYPLDKVTHDEAGTDFECAASARANKDCGGYQYHAIAKLAGMSPTFLELAVDWDRGQSGGPVFTQLDGQAQRVAVALVTTNKNGHNVARRIDPSISQKICSEVRLFPSARYPRHECNP